MDAYDIFKKLTKGLTFKHRVLGVKNKDQFSKPILKKEKNEQECELKEEVVQDADDFINPQTDTEVEESDDESDDELQVVEGAESELVKKEKKKKSKLNEEELKNKLEIEEQNRFRNEHGIKTVGRHIPNALKDFSELVTRHKLSQALVENVIQCGYSEPTAIQRQAIPCLLENRQIVACAPTGSGKTAAFLVPLLHILGAPQGGPRALVLCPTRELANQIYREALRLSASTQLRCSVIRSLKESKIKERESTIRKSDIVISTPNRLCYLINQDAVGITLDKVQWLIIDEADKLFEGSPEEVDTFRQQLDVIINSCKAKLAMFSATHTPSIGKWARHNMRGLVNITVGHRNAASSSVDQELLFCGNESGKLVAFRQLVQKGLKPPVLVFVQSKERAKQLFKELLYDGVQVDVIHADRTQAQRDKVVRSFRVGRVWVLLCTELMARGIDFRGVNLVVNYDLPPSAISYIHRVGRAGRAGAAGRAVTFFTLDDVVNLRSIAAVMKQSGCEVPEYMLKLKQNPNKRKNLLKKAPHRDKISTIVQKPEKRKPDDDSENKSEKTKDTENIKNGKNKKQRKVQTEKQNNKNQKENVNKSNKLGNNKRKKKKFVKPNV